MTDQSQAPLDQTVDSILTSKTFWTNVLAPGFAFLAAHYALNLDAATQGYVVALVMAVANIILRRISSRPVAFTASISK